MGNHPRVRISPPPPILSNFMFINNFPKIHTLLLHMSVLHRSNGAGEFIHMCTHLYRRGLMYYFRRRIPADLVQVCSKSEIVQSFKTTNRAEALIRLRQLDVNLDLKFAGVRLG
ncbi:hypothetical protein C6H68_16850 [Photorhabdus luminescens]|uniref:DUF6538 domain-containing protein n=2 Tax=Photorhabdus laumondii TaxID=2218628 RepID=UPI000D44E53A|nr:hypothetical protein C6H68_16850 [Photorhabdus luminescens]